MEYSRFRKSRSGHKTAIKPKQDKNVNEHVKKNVNRKTLDCKIFKNTNLAEQKI